MGTHGRTQQPVPGTVEAAEMLCALWRIGAEDADMPLQGTVLDRTLAACAEDLPPPLAGALGVLECRDGKRCTRLADVVAAAEDAGLLVRDGSTFLRVRTSLSLDEARMVVVCAGTTTDDAVRIGAALAEGCRRDGHVPAPFPAMRWRDAPFAGC